MFEIGCLEIDFSYVESIYIIDGYNLIVFNFGLT